MTDGDQAHLPGQVGGVVSAGVIGKDHLVDNLVGNLVGGGSNPQGRMTCASWGYSTELKFWNLYRI